MYYLFVFGGSVKDIYSSHLWTEAEADDIFPRNYENPSRIKLHFETGKHCRIIDVSEQCERSISINSELNILWRN